MRNLLLDIENNPRIVDYLKEGKAIEAVKELRNIAGCTLVEAKNACDEYRRQLEQKQTVSHPQDTAHLMNIAVVENGFILTIFVNDAEKKFVASTHTQLNKIIKQHS